MIEIWNLVKRNIFYFFNVVGFYLLGFNVVYIFKVLVEFMIKFCYFVSYFL